MITLKIIPILPLSPGGLRPGRASGSERRGRGEGEHAMSTPISIVRLSSRRSPPPRLPQAGIKGKIRLGNFHVLWEAIRPSVIGYKIKVVCLKVKGNPVRNSSGALNPDGIILKSDNHTKGTSEHTKRMDLMICLGKKPNPTPLQSSGALFLTG